MTLNIPEPAWFLEAAESIQDQLVQLRRSIHSHPELGLDCPNTARIVEEHLSRLGLDVQTGLASTGVTALLQGAALQPVLALRADLDALPLSEQTGLSFASTHQKRMHACAHDGHTAIVLGAASLLYRLRNDLPGSVKFIFQPGEESPGGAELMIKQGVLDNPPVWAGIGFHIYPGLPSGSVGICTKTATAGCTDFEIVLQGTGGHAAKPHDCRDPIHAAGQLIVALQSIVSRRLEPGEPAVLTLSQISSQGGYNIIPEQVLLKGTYRFIRPETKAQIQEHIQRILKGIEVAFELKASLEVKADEPALVVSEGLTPVARTAARELFPPDQVMDIDSSSMGSEDFARFSNTVPCIYFRLGCFDPNQGYSHGLHSPFFDFDESLLVRGAAYCAYLAWKVSVFLQTEEKPS